MKRRDLIKVIGLGAMFPQPILAEAFRVSAVKVKRLPPPKILMKKIPSTGEQIPVIGMGTSRTFNVGSSVELRNARTEVLKMFFNFGGRLIDSSPMYGSSEEVIGYGLKKLSFDKKLISATKVWTSSVEEGKKQFADSLKLWGLDKIDIYQIHNLLGWNDHLKILREYKQQNKIRYVGITTSHGRRIDDLAEIVKKEQLDFIQITYNLNERWNENKLLKIAADRGVAVIINRPFQRGDLFNKVQGKKLPKWAVEAGCKTWSQYFLKWVVSHPAVTCAIPATSRVSHMVENMGALKGEFFDEAFRLKMLKYYESI